MGYGFWVFGDEGRGDLPRWMYDIQHRKKKRKGFQGFNDMHFISVDEGHFPYTKFSNHDAIPKFKRPLQMHSFAFAPGEKKTLSNLYTVESVLLVDMAVSFPFRSAFEDHHRGEEKDGVQCWEEKFLCVRNDFHVPFCDRIRGTRLTDEAELGCKHQVEECIGEIAERADAVG